MRQTLEDLKGGRQIADRKFFNLYANDITLISSNEEEMAGS